MMGSDYEANFGLETFELYNQAREFRRKIYRLLRTIPLLERYCLVPQMRRAALSVSNNIAEGHGRWHYQENIQFCRVARSSIEETIDDLNVCLDENYALKEDAAILIARVNSYIQYLKRSRQGSD